MGKWLLLAALMASFAPRPALGWDVDGHRITGLIAERRMSPRARREVAALLGRARLSDREIAFWGDEIKRERPNTRTWHFVNVPVDAPALEPSRDCPDGQCCSAQIEHHMGVLADRTRSKIERVEAIKWIVHLIGDLHQPLHVGDRKDRGGNDIEVRPSSTSTETTDLHWVWDQIVLEASMAQVRAGSVDGFAAALAKQLTDASAKEMAQGDVSAWTTESHLVAREIYRDLPKPPEPLLLGDDYGKRHSARLNLQLQRAGVRIAAALERALVKAR